MMKLKNQPFVNVALATLLVTPSLLTAIALTVVVAEISKASVYFVLALVGVLPLVV